MDNIYNRTEILLGSENIELLKSKNILLCGIGGVGSYVLEALARIGIGNITIIDKDIIDVTNINRQIIALNSTVGLKKVDVAEKRVLDINNSLKVKSIYEKINKDNISNIINCDYDYVIDCIDDVEAKILIIKEAKSKNVNCISCMGTANKLKPLEIKVSDISKTDTCPLAKIIRKRLRNIGINKQKVVYSSEIPIKNKENNTLGSVSFVPSVAGLVIASEVVKDLIK